MHIWAWPQGDLRSCSYLGLYVNVTDHQGEFTRVLYDKLELTLPTWTATLFLNLCMEWLFHNYNSYITTCQKETDLGIVYMYLPHQP